MNFGRNKIKKKNHYFLLVTEQRNGPKPEPPNVTFTEIISPIKVAAFSGGIWRRRSPSALIVYGRTPALLIINQHKLTSLIKDWNCWLMSTRHLPMNECRIIFRPKMVFARACGLAWHVNVTHKRDWTAWTITIFREKLQMCLTCRLKYFPSWQRA